MAPGLFINRNNGAGAGLVLYKASDANSSPAVAVCSPDSGGTSGNLRGMIDNQGAFYSNANFVMSSTFAGTVDPTTGAVTVTDFGLDQMPADLQPTAFAMILADQDDCLVLKPFNSSNPSRLITAVDRYKNYLWEVDGKTGKITWGLNAATRSALDTGLGRIAAATLAVGNGAEGDNSGTLKLTQITFADGTSQTTAATSSGVTGVNIASGKSITVDSVISLAGVDGKTLTVNNSIGLSGTDGTSITFPATSASLAGLDLVQTWTASQTFTDHLYLANNKFIYGLNSTGGGIQLLGINSGNNCNVGSEGLTGNVQFIPGANQRFRFLNAAATVKIIDIIENSRAVCFGTNNSDSIWTFWDSFAGSGDSVLSIRAGAAREARVRFGSSSGTYDVGLQRDSAGGVLNVTDASTTATNYRGLRVRDLMVNGSSSLGGGTGVIALANATTPPASNPTGGGVLYVQNGALMYRGSSGTVTTIANA